VNDNLLPPPVVANGLIAQNPGDTIHVVLLASGRYSWLREQ
jgi:hypothetical protein